VYKARFEVEDPQAVASVLGVQHATRAVKSTFARAVARLQPPSPVGFGGSIIPAADVMSTIVP